MKLTSHQRRLEIARTVEGQGSVRVADLIRRYRITDTSIRRDLEILESQGRLRRLHGGAVANGRNKAEESFREKTRQHPEEKARIGKAAARLIHPGDTIVLDSGTTVLQVAHHIPTALEGNASLTVVTNSIPAMIELQDLNALHLISLGGIFIPEFQATVGPLCVANLRRMQVDKAFIGCDGLSVSHGLTTPHLLVAEVGRVIAEIAREVIVVADSSKLGRIGFTPIAPLNAAHKLITDSGAAPEFLAQLRDVGIEVVLA